MQQDQVIKSRPKSKEQLNGSDLPGVQPDGLPPVRRKPGRILHPQVAQVILAGTQRRIQGYSK